MKNYFNFKNLVKSLSVNVALVGTILWAGPTKDECLKAIQDFITSCNLNKKQLDDVNDGGGLSLLNEEQLQSFYSRIVEIENNKKKEVAKNDKEKEANIKTESDAFLSELTETVNFIRSERNKCVNMIYKFSYLKSNLDRLVTLTHALRSLELQQLQSICDMIEEGGGTNEEAIFERIKKDTGVDVVLPIKKKISTPLVVAPTIQETSIKLTAQDYLKKINIFLAHCHLKQELLVRVTNALKTKPTSKFGENELCSIYDMINSEASPNDILARISKVTGIDVDIDTNPGLTALKESLVCPFFFSEKEISSKNFSFILDEAPREKKSNISEVFKFLDGLSIGEIVAFSRFLVKLHDNESLASKKQTTILSFVRKYPFFKKYFPTDTPSVFVVHECGRFSPPALELFSNLLPKWYGKDNSMDSFFNALKYCQTCDLKNSLFVCQQNINRMTVIKPMMTDLFSHYSGCMDFIAYRLLICEDEWFDHIVSDCNKTHFQFYFSELLFLLEPELHTYMSKFVSENEHLEPYVISEIFNLIFGLSFQLKDKNFKKTVELVLNSIIKKGDHKEPFSNYEEPFDCILEFTKNVSERAFLIGKYLESTTPRDIVLRIFMIGKKRFDCLVQNFVEETESSTKGLNNSSLASDKNLKIRFALLAPEIHPFFIKFINENKTSSLEDICKVYELLFKISKSPEFEDNPDVFIKFINENQTFSLEDICKVYELLFKISKSPEFEDNPDVVQYLFKANAEGLFETINKNPISTWSVYKFLRDRGYLDDVPSTVVGSLIKMKKNPFDKCVSLFDDNVKKLKEQLGETFLNCNKDVMLLLAFLDSGPKAFVEAIQSGKFTINEIRSIFYNEKVRKNEKMLERFRKLKDLIPGEYCCDPNFIKTIVSLKTKGFKSTREFVEQNKIIISQLNVNSIPNAILRVRYFQKIVKKYSLNQEDSAQLLFLLSSLSDKEFEAFVEASQSGRFTINEIRSIFYNEKVRKNEKMLERFRKLKDLIPGEYCCDPNFIKTIVSLKTKGFKSTREFVEQNKIMISQLNVNSIQNAILRAPFYKKLLKKYSWDTESFAKCLHVLSSLPKDLYESFQRMLTMGGFSKEEVYSILAQFHFFDIKLTEKNEQSVKTQRKNLFRWIGVIKSIIPGEYCCYNKTVAEDLFKGMYHAHCFMAMVLDRTEEDFLDLLQALKENKAAIQYLRGIDILNAILWATSIKILYRTNFPAKKMSPGWFLASFFNMKYHFFSSLEILADFFDKLLTVCTDSSDDHIAQLIELVGKLFGKLRNKHYLDNYIICPELPNRLPRLSDIQSVFSKYLPFIPEEIILNLFFLGDADYKNVCESIEEVVSLKWPSNVIYAVLLEMTCAQRTSGNLFAKNKIPFDIWFDRLCYQSKQTSSLGNGLQYTFPLGTPKEIILNLFFIDESNLRESLDRLSSIKSYFSKYFLNDVPKEILIAAYFLGDADYESVCESIKEVEVSELFTKMTEEILIEMLRFQKETGHKYKKNKIPFEDVWFPVLCDKFL